MPEPYTPIWETIMANEMNRRDIVKFAAALAVGAATADSVLGQQASSAAGAGRVEVDVLALAKSSPERFMLSEPEILTLDSDGHSRDLVITSARDENGNPTSVIVRSRSIRIFRADSTVDEFTSQGGVYWRFRDQPGKTKLKQTPSSNLFQSPSNPGLIVMVVREEEAVRMFTMTFDLRC